VELGGDEQSHAERTAHLGGLRSLLADAHNAAQVGRSPVMFNSYDSSEDNQPVTWVRGYPVFAAHLIVIGFVASMLVTTLMMAFGGGTLLSWLPFNSGLVLRGEIWRVLTYGLVNPPSLDFVIDMAMIGWFGREVERVYGRRSFLSLYGCLYLISPLIFTVAGRWLPASMSGESGALALFVAFAVIYPDVPMFFSLMAKWVAAILVGIYTLMALSGHAWVSLITLWATVGFAFAFVRWKQGKLTLPTVRLWEKKPKLRVLPDLKPVAAAPLNARKIEPMEEVDALLDKIAKSGIRSLSAKERARLETARAELLKRR
jgi:membrane associated rhomboid family serine protease